MMLTKPHLELARPSRTDPVTHLPNRQAFLEEAARLGFAAESEPCWDSASGAAVSCPPGAALFQDTTLFPDSTLFMVNLADPRHFHDLLGALGHDYADAFIREGAARLQSALGGKAPLYHVSLLSFAFVQRTARPAELAASLAYAFSQPLICEGIPINNRTGIGLVACGPEAAAAELLRAAFTAAQDSRGRPEGWSFYSSRLSNPHQRALTLLTDFTRALRAKDQLSLHFQPKIDFASGICRSVEALLRWTHPKYGPIPPAEFIPLIEATALIHSLTRWVTERAVAQSARWRREGIELTVAINVSPLNFARAEFSNEVIGALERHQLPGSRVQIEITETALIANYEIVKTQLLALRASGINAAIDDFGIGFSNLSNLTRLPMNILKLDQSLIQRMETDPRTGLLVRNVIDMAHRLDYRIVAEGIETASSYRQLSQWGCDEGQGYFMSRPLAAKSFVEWFRAR